MDILTQYYIALLVTGIINGGLGIFVFLKGFNKRLNQTLALYSLSLFLWSVFEALGITRQNESLALALWRINHIGVIFIPIFLTHFVFVLLDIKGKRKKLIPISYLVACIFLILDATPLLISEVVPKFSFRYFINPGQLYYIFFWMWVGWAIYGNVELFKEYFRASGYRKNQMQYFCWSLLFSYIGGVPNFFPTFNIEIPILMPFGTYAIPLYAFVTAYAIVKYRFMDIKLARSYIALYLSYGVIGAILFIIPIFILRHSIIGIVFLVITAFLAAPRLFQWTAKFLEPAFMGNAYRTRKQLDKLRESELGYLSEQIAWNLVGGISEILHIDQISLFLDAAKRKELRPTAQIGLDDVVGSEQIPWVTLTPESALVKHLSKTKQLLIKDELGNPESKRLIEEMARLRAEISIPLFVQGELIGILNLGPKPDKEMYHQEELKKITDLCSQAENHLSHARFMENRATFSRQLAHDMKNLVVKNIEPTFAELCETKDEKKRQELLNTVFSQHQYLKICLKNNFDLVSLVERLAYHKYILEPAQIARVITACSSLYKTPCAKAGISIEQDVPKNLPPVLVNREDIPKVFNNLFDNALKFTPSGGKIKIKAEQKDDEVLIIFSDTGRGMSEEKLKTIFEPSVKMPDNEVPDNEEGAGTGLGLVIVKDIIEAQGGRIWIKSELGKGTTFYFTLRIVKENNENKKEV